MTRISVIIMLLFLMSCNMIHNPEDVEDTPTLQNVPAIVKALEMIANVDKKEVDKEEKK